MQELILEVDELGVGYGADKILHSITFQIRKGENWAVVGGMGTGKTTLAKSLSGRLFRTGTVRFFGSDHPANVYLVEQQHQFKNRSNVNEFYLQQRFNSSDSADSYTIREELALEDKEEACKWMHLFQMEDHWEKPILQLSNGENKRLQMVKALLKKPDFLLFDNPFLGLDTDGRELLNQALCEIHLQGIPFLVINSPGEMPSIITHVMVLNQGKLVWKGSKEVYQASLFDQESIADFESNLNELIRTRQVYEDFQIAVRMENVQICYGNRMILRNQNWIVKKGEAWALRGPNGAGKSTMISMITADNPQSYSQALWLFDRRRGTGESIWDIKKRIGFVSPELHLYFKNTGICLSVVGSGLLDTLGLFKPLSDEQKNRSFKWMQVLGISHLANKEFYKISQGEQRIVLLARAFVKNPPLLILDEPCQGLDIGQIAHVKKVLDYIVKHSNTTLIYVSHYVSDIPTCVKQEKELSLEPINQQPIA
ncbi:MAG: hypothetical protein RJA76_347 [Bacteroidota bacterium]|jgi:molybdate transport system ATP-binding protein